MDLKTFVTETLTQIAAGIKDAQCQQEELGALFSPEHSIIKDHITRKNDHNKNVFDLLELVEFDVALTVSGNISGGAKAGLEVMGVSLAGAKAEVTKQNETISHIKFNVVVRWPRCDGPPPESMKN